jgi:hypothetical protein
VIGAGAAHGIAADDEFALYKGPDPSWKSRPLAIFVVRKAESFRSIIAPISRFNLRFKLHDKLHKPTFALLWKAVPRHQLPVYAAEYAELISIFSAPVGKSRRQPNRPGILRTLQKEGDVLVLDLVQKKVVFNDRGLDKEEVAAFFHSQRIPFSIELDVNKVQPVVNAAADFHWYLKHGNEVHRDLLRDMVRFEFTKVECVQSDEDQNPVIKSIGENLNKDGVIRLVSGTQTYGLRIINDSRRDFHASLFYFNVNNLSISTYLLCICRVEY